MKKKRRKALTASRLKTAFAPELVEILEDSMLKRAAYFLNWAADRYPHEYIPWNWVHQAINGFKRTPAPDNTDVKRLQARSSAIRSHCVDKFGRTTDSHTGLGVRALVDDADVLKYAVPKQARRMESARVSFLTATALVNINKVPNTPALKPLKAWFNTDVKAIMKMIGGDNFSKRLQSPKDDDE